MGSRLTTAQKMTSNRLWLLASLPILFSSCSHIKQCVASNLTGGHTQPCYPALFFPHRWREGGWLCLGGPLPTTVWLSVYLWLVQYYRLQWRVPRANQSCYFTYGESGALKRRKTSKTWDRDSRITGRFSCFHLVEGSPIRRSITLFGTLIIARVSFKQQPPGLVGSWGQGGWGEGSFPDCPARGTLLL